MNLYGAFWIAGIVLFSVYSLFIYNKGYDSAEQKFIAKIEANRLSNTTLLRNLENEHRNRENAIISDYLKQIEELNHRYEDISNAKLSDTVKCVSDKTANRRVSKDTNKQGLTCYTDAQLREKIKRSMDIARECDAVVLKYNALIKSLEVYTK